MAHGDNVRVHFLGIQTWDQFQDKFPGPLDGFLVETKVT